MSGWPHRHVLDLASFAREDFAAVLELAQRFRSLPITGARKLPALQGRLVATLFFEPSTRTRSSFELAAKRLSADVMSFSPSSSSLSKGESVLDTARTYVAMGADVLVVRHRSTGVPQQLALDLQQMGERTVVLNGAMDFIAIPVRDCWICSRLPAFSLLSTPCRRPCKDAGL